MKNRFIPDALGGCKRVRKALTWIGLLGTEHCLVDCDCVICDYKRDTEGEKLDVTPQKPMTSGVGPKRGITLTVIPQKPEEKQVGR